MYLIKKKEKKRKKFCIFSLNMNHEFIIRSISNVIVKTECVIGIFCIV